MEGQEEQTALNGPAPFCDDAVLEQIRHEVSEGFSAVGHGGLEIGGVLFGESKPEGLRIGASRPLLSEYAFGPALRLSSADEEALGNLVRDQDLHLAGLEPVGWYRSYTRHEAAVTASDVVVMDRYFPKPGNFLLLLKPTSRYRVSGLFFVRGEQGLLNLEPAGEELTLRPRLDFVPRGPFALPEKPPSIAPDPVSSPAQISPPSNQKEKQLLTSEPAFRLPLGRIAGMVFLLIVGFLAGLGYFTYAGRVTAEKPATPPPPAAALTDSQQQEIAQLKSQFTELTARNRRLEETLAIVRSKPQPQKQPVTRSRSTRHRAAKRR